MMATLYRKENNIGLGLAAVSFYLAAQAIVRARWPFGFVQLDFDADGVALWITVRPDLGLSLTMDRFRVGMGRVTDLASLEFAIAQMANRKGHWPTGLWTRTLARDDWT